jgi:putative hydrolase of the HAD superfamily
MIKAIFFDIDNTLIDFWKMKQKSCEAAIDAMIAAGLNVERETALKTLFELYDKYGIEHKEIFEKLLKQMLGKVDYRIVAHGIIAYRKLRDTQLMPYPGTIPTLIELKKKYKLAIVSDAPRLNAWFRLVSLKIDEFFDVVITAADVRKQKTYSAPFKAAIKKLDIRPEEALMVGDRVKRDIETAKKFGMKTCYARYGEKNPLETGKSGADCEINEVKDILKCLAE